MLGKRAIARLAPAALAVVMTMLASQTMDAQRNRGNVRSSSRNNVHSRNTNVNQNRNVNRNTNVNRNIDIDRDIDVDVDVHGGYRYGGCCYHPVATAAAVTATAVVTAAVVGSIVHTLPPSCTVVVVNGFSYQQCGSTWYQPQLAGGSTTYVVVNPPR